MISKYYEQYNPNPLKKEVGDCVIRALCVVTNRSWYDIYDELSDLGRTKCAPFNTIMNELIEENICHHKALEEIEEYVRDNSDFDRSDILTSGTGAYDILDIINKAKGLQ